MPRSTRIVLLVAFALLAAAGVGLWDGAADDRGERPQRLRIGVVPSAPRERLEAAHGPLVEYLGGAIGIPCELIVPVSYEDLLERFGRGDLDLVWCGPLMFLRAREDHGAIPCAIRDVDARLCTVFVARREDAGLSLSAFQGRSLALGNAWSTSGNFMARVELAHAHLDVDADFLTPHAHATHDDTVLHVRDGRADLGATNLLHLEAMYAEGVVSRDEVVVVHRSRPYTGYVWAARAGLARDVRLDVREALLALDPAVAPGAGILRLQRCGGYLPVSIDEFDALERHVRSMGYPERP